MESKLFTPVNIGPVTLRNRTIRYAAFESMCPGNVPSKELLDYHLTIIGLVLCVFFMKSIVRIIVWLFGFLMRNFIYVIIIVVLVVCLLKGCGGA